MIVAYQQAAQGKRGSLEDVGYVAVGGVGVVILIDVDIDPAADGIHPYEYRMGLLANGNTHGFDLNHSVFIGTGQHQRIGERLAVEGVGLHLTAAVDRQLVEVFRRQRVRGIDIVERDAPWRFRQRASPERETWGLINSWVTCNSLSSGSLSCQRSPTTTYS